MERPISIFNYQEDEAMATRKNTRPGSKGDTISATIGDNASQVAVGKNIHQQQVKGSLELTPADLKQVEQLFADLRKQVEQQAPPEKKEAALERVDELQQEVASPKPQVSTMEYVHNWFGKNIPSLLGAVTGVVVNPIVGKVVEAAGSLAAQELKRRFGGA
jgi:hypothetical protein